MRIKSRTELMIATALASLMPIVGFAQHCRLDLVRPACGKVCKLVCETKKITAIGYGSECKDICLPPPSRQGCKHCAVACGECKCDPCTCCQSTAPKCEFCWRDWFACGCSCPRSVKVLTKYQAEKKICWYHWEVVDAASCDCTSLQNSAAGELGIVQSSTSRDYYKAAPEDSKVGDLLAVLPEEWVKLAAYLQPAEAAPPNTPWETKTTLPN
jgi:hypothetical protein